MKITKLSPGDEKKVIALLRHHDCRVPYHEVRTRFLGNIASPLMTTSPMRVLKDLWGGELPEFESMEAVNELIGLLINGLWNSLTRHQKRSEPFRLIKIPIAQTRAGLAELALMRRQEIDGFVEGLFAGKEEIGLPERASASMDVIRELRAMIAAVHTLARDATKAGSDKECATTIRQVQELTPIIEREINATVLACIRARRQSVQKPNFPGPTVH